MENAPHAARTRPTEAETGRPEQPPRDRCLPEHLPWLSAHPQGWGWTHRWAVNLSHVAGMTLTLHQHKGWGNQADFV